MKEALTAIGSLLSSDAFKTTGVFAVAAGAIYSFAQLAVPVRAQIFGVYAKVREIMDESELREARHWVYATLKAKSVPQGGVKDCRRLFEDEHWLDTDAISNPSARHDANENRRKAERVMRAFDWLGLFVREGLVPVDLVARFYTYGILNCWYLLWPYIQALRSQQNGRDQQGHMWEFEYLATRVVLEGVKEGKGVWKGVKEHDGLSVLVGQIEKELREEPRDRNFNPGANLWYLSRWWKIVR